MTFDPNDYKQEVVDLVKKETGRDLKIDGDIGLTFYPWLGVTTDAVELSNAPGFSPDVFARTEKVAIRVKLMPLLSKSVEMDTVSVQGLTLNLATDETGKTNWDDLTKDGETESTGGSDGSGIGAIAIGGLDIRGANITWTDAELGAVTLSNLNATTGSFTPGKPVDLNIEFDVAGGPTDLEGHVVLSGELNMDPDSGKFDAKGLKFEANLIDQLLPGGKARFAFGADVSADINNQTASAANLTLSALGLDVSGNVAVSDYEAKPQLTGNLSIKQFDPKGMLMELDPQGMLKELFGIAIETTDPTALTAVAIDMTFSGNQDSLTLKPSKSSLMNQRYRAT